MSNNLVDSIIILGDGKLLAVLKSGSKVYLQPPLVVDSYDNVSEISIKGRFLNNVKIDTSISSVNGYNFSDEPIETINKAVRGIAYKANSFSNGSNSKDFYFDVSDGKVDNHSVQNKFGTYKVALAGVANNDILGGGGVYVPPTADRIHQVKSDNIEDTGTKRGDYTSTTFGVTKFIDSGANFIVDSVAVGDVVMNDTTQDHSLVVSVDSATELTVKPWHHSNESNVGDSFRIAGLAAGKTGTPVIHIRIGYKEMGEELKEFIIMNGIISVPTLNSYYRITRVHQHGSTSAGYNIGLVTLTADVDATITAQIEPKKGQTQMAFVHVPYGSKGLVKEWGATMHREGAAKDALAALELVTELWGTDGENVKSNGGCSIFSELSKSFDCPISISQGTDIWIRSTSTSDTNTIISATLDVIIKKL